MWSSVVCLTLVLAYCLGLTTESPRIHQACPVSQPCRCRWDNPTIDRDSQRNEIVCSKSLLKDSSLPVMRATNSSFHKIDLSFNLLDELPGDFLTGLYGVEFVDISDNKLTSLPSTVADYSTLKWLRMSHNYVEKIESKPFQNLKSLVMLNLTFNRITELNDDSFVGLDRLENLFLDKNKIASISSKAFSEMTQLKKIDLTDNKLESLPDGLFDGLSAMTFLDLNSNKLTDIPGNAFKDLKSLKELNLENNKLTTLQPDSLVGLFKVFSLKLSKNLIVQFPDGLFRDMFTLRLLDLHGNHLANLTKSVFQNEKAGANLGYLFLGGGSIKEFEDDFFSQFPRLAALDLTSSPLKSMPILRFCPGLRTLSIAHTAIRTIYECDLEGLNQLTKVYWSLAPIDCDCNLKWLRSWFDQHIDQISYNKQEGGPWKCTTPLSVRNTPFQLLKEEQFVCADDAKPVTCPYYFDPISEKIIRGNPDDRVDYVLEVTAEFDGETLSVDWDRDSLLVADDKIKKFQVLLHYDDHYLATTFPVDKDKYSLSVNDVLSADVSKFNVCVEVVGYSNEIITFGCVEFSSEESASGSGSGTKIMIGIIVPLMVIALIVVGVVVYLTCFRKGAPSGIRGEGIPNVMYDPYKESDYSEPSHASQISISGLPAEEEVCV